MTKLVLKPFATTAILFGVSFFSCQVSAQSPGGGLPDEIANSIPQIFSAEELAEQMQSPRARQRDQAARNLESMGADAHKTLEAIINQAKGGAPTRALQILERAFQSKNAKLSGSAAETLTRIAQSKSEHSRAAADILSPPAEKRQDNLPGGFPGQRIPKMFGDQFGNFSGASTSISVRTINGVREITIKENGQRFDFKDVDGGIEVRRPGGKGGVTTKVYKDADEIKKQDVEAHQMYERASGSGGMPDFKFRNGFDDFPFPGFGRMPDPFGNLLDEDSPFPRRGNRGMAPRQFAPQPGIPPNPVPRQPLQPNQDDEQRPRLKLMPLDRAPAPKNQPNKPPANRIEV